MDDFDTFSGCAYLLSNAPLCHTVIMFGLAGIHDESKPCTMDTSCHYISIYKVASYCSYYKRPK